MNRVLSILLLAGVGLGIMAWSFDGGTTVEFADGLYTLAGVIFYIAGTWLAIRVLMGRNE